MTLDNILMAHYKTKQTLILHGSSGFGKSSQIHTFATKNGFKLVEKRTCYIDPIECVLPIRNDQAQLIDTWPSRWIHDLMTTTEPTVLFLDEFNRPASMQTFNMFTELLLDRSISGLKISDMVLIVGACNLDSEDTGVIPIPDAVMNRATHILHAPDDMAVMANMRNKLAQEAIKAVGNINKVMDKPGAVEFKVKACPRQLDAVATLFQTKLLDEHELGLVSRGRLGIEKGNTFASVLIKLDRKEEFKLPNKVTPKTYEAIHKCEAEGMIIEVGNLLKQEEHEAKHVANYLLQYAGPETCRTLHESGFGYTYPKNVCPTDKEGEQYVDIREEPKPITQQGMCWQIIALGIGKLAMKSKQ